MYEPIWIPKKTLSAVAQGLSAILAAVGFAADGPGQGCPPDVWVGPVRGARARHPNRKVETCLRFPSP